MRENEAKALNCLRSDSEGSDQTEWMPSLISEFAWRIRHFVGLFLSRLNFMSVHVCANNKDPKFSIVLRVVQSSQHKSL